MVEGPLLSCRGLDVSYGAVQVLFDVDLDVAEGEIVALLGTNGAGKSTLLKAISGLLRPSKGRIQLDGRNLVGLTADRTAALGVVQMPGGKAVFPTLTVEENLRLSGWLFRRDRKRFAAARDEVLDLFPRLAERIGQMAGNLSGGEQQMLSLAQAFMNRPRLLMIDELSLGLAPAVVGQLLEVVDRIHSSGTTIIVVEQSVNVALTLARRAVFMEKGEVRFEGETAELLDRPDILRSVFISGAAAVDGGPDGDLEGGPEGGPAGANGSGPRQASEPVRLRPVGDGGVDHESAPVLECVAVSKRFGGVTAVDSVDLQLKKGQILGLIGQNGAGKTTLFDLISGFLRPDGGRILLGGVEVSSWAPFERARGRLGRSFQEARLFPSLAVWETIAVALERHVASRDAVAAAFHLPASYEAEDDVRARVEELVELMGLGAFHDKLVGELSTGTRRIVELACLLGTEPAVVLLDEPSAGVAQRETEALGPLLLRVKETTGCTIGIIEHDMPLLRSICDEMVALELGSVIASGDPDAVLSDPHVVRTYLGTDEAVINRSGATGGGGGSKGGSRGRSGSSKGGSKGGSTGGAKGGSSASARTAPARRGSRVRAAR